MNDYTQVTLNEALENDLRLLVRLAIAEDLRDAMDWTTVCLIPPDCKGACQVVPRADGVCAGVALVKWIVDEFDADLKVECLQEDGTPLVSGQPIVRLEGNARDILTSERTILNILCRLCGIATLTNRYVKAMAGMKARLYDTRKTTPGWRLIEKYAVSCGSGHNHRSGLYDGFLIKDNHLALAGNSESPMSAGAAARKAISWRSSTVEHLVAPPIVEIEVDSLEQFRDVISTRPDIVLLDNFSIEQLRQAVAIRDEAGIPIELEASGNVKLDTIAEIASTGVDRISSGALTHQATSLDLGLDWYDKKLS